jgi:hypothetical protein
MVVDMALEYRSSDLHNEREGDNKDQEGSLLYTGISQNFPHIETGILRALNILPLGVG